MICRVLSVIKILLTIYFWSYEVNVLNVSIAATNEWKFRKSTKKHITHQTHRIYLHRLLIHTYTHAAHNMFHLNRSSFVHGQTNQFCTSPTVISMIFCHFRSVSINLRMYLYLYLCISTLKTVRILLLLLLWSRYGILAFSECLYHTFIIVS